MYDDFSFVDRVVDPGYVYHSAMADLWSRVALRLAEAEVLPLRYSNTAQFVLDEVQSLRERIDDANAGVASGQRQAGRRSRSARARRAHAARSGERGGVARRPVAHRRGAFRRRRGGLNASLIATERALCGSGLPGRTWFRHELYAPGLNTGYAAVPLPRLGQAVLDKDHTALRARRSRSRRRSSGRARRSGRRPRSLAPR